jgi:hypothetical protein
MNLQLQNPADVMSANGDLLRGLSPVSVAGMG